MMGSARRRFGRPLLRWDRTHHGKQEAAVAPTSNRSP